MREEKITQLLLSRHADICVVLEDVHDPHNAAAVLRSCDAFGVHKVHFVFETVTPYNPKKVGKVSSSSANKWLDISTHTSTQETLAKLSEQGFEHMATSLSEKSISLYEVSFTQKPLAIWFGNEHAGLSATAVQGCTQHVIIPLAGMVQSLNISVSAGCVLSEMQRQKITHQHHVPFDERYREQQLQVLSR